MRAKKYFAIFSFAILFLGTSGFSISNVYADDLFPAPWRGAETSYHAQWIDIDPSVLSPPDPFSQGPSDFPLFDLKDFSPTTPSEGFLDACLSQSSSCTFFLPNFVDELEKKFFRVQVTYTGPTPFDGSLFGDVDGSGPFPVCTLIDRQDPSPGFYYEDWECSPNPHLEQYFIERTSNSGTQPTQIVVDTISFNEPAPTGLSAMAVSSTQINLSWTTPPVDNDGGFVITGYKIERESPIGGGFSVIVADTGSTATTYSDMGLPSDTQFNYRVSAIKETIGVGPPSNEADAMTASEGEDLVLMELQQINQRLDDLEEDHDFLAQLIQNIGSMAVGGIMIPIDTIALLAAGIGMDPLITGLLLLSIVGISIQVGWILHKKKKSD